jgi:hypothetical protein
MRADLKLRGRMRCKSHLENEKIHGSVEDGNSFFPKYSSVTEYLSFKDFFGEQGNEENLKIRGYTSKDVDSRDEASDSIASTYILTNLGFSLRRWRSSSDIKI